VARHPQRPYTRDYVNGLFGEFRELHGDRTFGDDPAIIGGLARFNGAPCIVIGQQKGRDTKEKIFRNFGMPRPEGYRKALTEALRHVQDQTVDALVEAREDKILGYGRYKEIAPA
jgi:acetyl-CoA carboxylase alpha subunit